MSIVERTVEQQVVVVTNTIVQIQPANPQVIYVPTYPQTVYVQQAPPPSSADVAGAALVGFTVGVIVGANNNHYHHHYDDYWDDREDYYEDRQDECSGRIRISARPTRRRVRMSARRNQDERQVGHGQAGNQVAAPVRRGLGAVSGSGRSSAAPVRRALRAVSGSGQRAIRRAFAQPGRGGQRSAKVRRLPASRGGGQTASRSSGMSSGGSRAIRAAPPLDPRVRGAAAACPPAGAAGARRRRSGGGRGR